MIADSRVQCCALSRLPGRLTDGADRCSPPGRRMDGRLTTSCNRVMETTKLSSKGQVVLPKSVREEHGWGPGTEFEIESTVDDVRLRAKAPFPRTELGNATTTAPRSRVRPI